MSEEQLPHFPLSPKPRCRRCGWQPKFRNIVKATNPNGNAGRPYYICVLCKKRSTQGVGDHYTGWIAWDDDCGMSIDNPKCHCGIASRQDKAGADALIIPNLGFWTCATGRCDYFSDFENEQTDEQREESPNMAGNLQFEPWLL